MGILDQFRLDGKIALVTGCKTGIGRGIAQGLAEAGADIIGVSRTLEESGSQIEKDVKAVGRKFKAYRYDFSDRKALYEFIKQVKADFPVIDILVSNAGTTRFADAENFPDEYWDEVMEVNVNSHFILSREIGRDMLARGKGKIIFIGSVAMFKGAAKSTIYAASKGAIGQLMRTLANVWAGRGVNVNAIAPGWVKSEMTKWLTEDAEGVKAALAGIPAGRVGDPQDYKGVAVYLSSAASDYVHGSVIVVDGGQMVR